MITAGGNTLLHPCLATLDGPDLGSADSVSLGKNPVALIGCSYLSGDLHRQFGERAAADVFGWSDGLQVGRIDTRPLTTEMIDLEPLWNYPDLLSVHRNMGKRGDSFQMESPIPTTNRRTLEDPARRLKTAIFFQPHVGSNAVVSLEIPNVSADETNMLSGHVTDSSIRHCRDRGRPPATARVCV